MSEFPKAASADDLAFPHQEFARVLSEARQGSLASQGRLLEAFRLDLLSIAAANLDSDIRTKGSASDLVQESLLEAHRDFHSFRGTTREEARAWLRRILLHNLVNHFRHWRAEKRQADREVSLDLVGDLLHDTAPDAAASEIVWRSEQRLRLEQALVQLSADHRQVLELRHRDGLPFEIIGQQLNRTSDAARMLWYRAFEELSRRLK